MPTLAAALCDAEQRLAGATPTPRLDAEVLLAHVLGKARSHLVAWPARRLEPDAQACYANLIAARADGRPVAYLTGEREFWSLLLRVTEQVLIPRPETETLVERASEIVARSTVRQVLDLGTGSGAIALALAHRFPRVQLLGADLSAAALQVAERNRARLGLTNLRLIESDWFSAAGEGYGLVVANPPYVASGDAHLAAGDVRFEPRLALDGGADGLDCLRAIAAAAPRHLAPRGWLLLEHGCDQGQAVRQLLAAAGFDDIVTRRDLAGLERASEGRLA